MMLQCVASQWLLLLWVYVLCTQAWLAHKCIVYDDATNWPSDTGCPGLHHTAACHDVTDIRRDVRGLPSDLQTLCVDVSRAKRVHGALPDGSFSGPPNLRHLYVGGCFSRVLNGSFRGLAELRSLTLRHLYVPLDCCEAAITPAALLDLPSLRELRLHGYSLRKLQPHVFASLPQLRRLFVNATCDDDLAEVICRVTPVTSLWELTLNAPLVQELKRHHCSDAEGVLEREDVPLANLTTVRLTVGMVTAVEPGALSCFPRLTYLSLQMKEQLHQQLNQTAIQTIEFLDYGQSEIYMQEMCAVVSTFSIKRIDLHYDWINMSDFDPNQCKSLEGLSLLSNSASTLSSKFLYDLPHLTYLAVEGQTVNTMCLPLPPPAPWLTTLRLKFTILGQLYRHEFSCLSHLSDLDLVANRISDIEDYSFEGLECLRHLRLSFNNVSVIREHTFSGLSALETLHLSENPLLRIAERSFQPLLNLRELVLRTLGCPLSRRSVSRLNLTHMFGSIPANLSSLTILLGPGPMSLAAGGPSSPQRPLALRLVSSSITLEDCQMPFFRSVVTFLVASREVMCRSEFIGKYMQSLETFEFLSDFPPQEVDLSNLNALTCLRRLRLQNLDLLQQPSLGSLLHNLTSLRTLILFNCSLSYLGPSLARDLRSLTGLLVKSDEVMEVSLGFVQSLPSLRYLLLQRLQLLCSCESAWLADWPRETEQVEVVVSRPSLGELRCLKDTTHSNNFLRYAERECFSRVGFFFFLVSTLTVVLFTLAPMMHLVAGPYFPPLYHILRGWLFELGQRSTSSSYAYDAFVSYSGHDEQWVMEELLPNLERPGPPFLRLCLHSRDFQLGKDVVENITDSLYASRRTLCLVSRHFLRSSWCSLELRLATYRLQVERRDVLILVFLEEIPSRLLSAHHRLPRLLKTRTYIHWPHDPAQQQAFWDRLWAKLAPPGE